jgi:hypothetical protein
VIPGWLDPYIVGHYRLEVVNDVFNDVSTSDLVVLPRRTRSTAWHCDVGSPSTVAVSGEWSTVLVPHCNRLSTRYTGIDCAPCMHVLQAHDDPDVRCL